MSEQAAASPAVSPGRLVVRAVLQTHVGLVRSENQDFGAYTTPEEEKGSHPGGRLLVVADGMGGHRGGATASRLAAETVKAQFLGSETVDIAHALRDALARANARIFSEAQANPDLRGMGTTTSALAIRGRHGWFAHVGDSRIYMIRGEEIKQLTDDHSLVASMVREGLLTTKEAEVHPRRNVLQRSMGVSEDVEIDVRGPFQVQDGDTFILCSDGLHGLVKEPELKEVAKLSIERAADEFLKRALDRGAPDNVTVIVARVEKTDEIGDETLIDTKLDETQPLSAVTEDTLAFDETVRDTTLPQPATIETAVPDDEKDTDEVPVTTADLPVVQQIDPLPPTLETAVPADQEDTDEIPPDLIAAVNSVPERTTELPMDEAAAAAPATAPVPPKKRGLLKWFLVVVLVAGAAGAVIFWNKWNNQQEANAAPSSSPSTTSTP